MQNRKRDTDVQNRLLDSVGEGEDGMFWENSIETSILSRVKQITSPGWMHDSSVQGWCTGRPRGMGWGGRQEGGSGWGTHVNPWLIHVNVGQKPLQYCKVISFQLIKINGKNKTENKIPYANYEYVQISLPFTHIKTKRKTDLNLFLLQHTRLLISLSQILQANPKILAYACLYMFWSFRY